MSDNYYIVIDREKVFVSEEVYKTCRLSANETTGANFGREGYPQWSHQL